MTARQSGDPAPTPVRRAVARRRQRFSLGRRPAPRRPIRVPGPPPPPEPSRWDGTSLLFAAGLVGVAAVVGWAMVSSVDRPDEFTRMFYGLGLLFVAGLPWSVVDVLLSWPGYGAVLIIGPALNVVLLVGCYAVRH